MISIALPKGRLGNSVYKKLAAIGYSCPEMLEDNRKLIFENTEKGVRYILVKPSDVAVYVEHGAADVGIVGYDVLLESDPDVFELLDLNIGKCSICVAAPNGFADELKAPLRVATKYPHVAKSYYSKMNRSIEIINLHGSIELAPIVGLSDVIVDIVETGTTLRENGLYVCSHIVDSSARFIANKSSYQFKRQSIEAMLVGLEADT
ncbi:MAG: ATP phosphoribosyltransferase [Oscillospiraceae bacterium]|nr:ATP phosphoribosyltransferase [Oscillospiraceae bacterium]